MSNFDAYIKEARAKGSMKLAKRMRDEKIAASGLVKAILKAGYMISIDNGEDWPVKKSRSYREVMDNLWACDEEKLLLRDMVSGEKIGWFYLVFGNSGAELVCDYSDNDACNAVYDALRPLIERLEA